MGAGVAMSYKDFLRVQGSWAYKASLWAKVLAGRYPRFYLLSALILMLPGFCILLLFPSLVVTGAGVLVEELPKVKTMEHWLAVEIWFAILLFCLFFSQQIAQLNFPRVAGLKLSRELVPDLYSVVGSVQQLTGQLAIRDIVITDRYELRIEEIPRFGYPLLMRKTLVVGMPLLQTLSEEQFRNMLMHLFVQYAGGRFRPVHWIYRCRLWWCSYQTVLEKRRRFWFLPLRWFFSIYAPLFAALTAPSARMDVLSADGAVLEWLNDRDYFDTLKSNSIAEIFLENYFWRGIYSSVMKQTGPGKAYPRPFEKLEHVDGYLKSKEFRGKCLEAAHCAETDITSVIPSLQIRMENIGQLKLRETPLVERTAAAACLGETRKNMVSLIDKLWSSTTLVQWRAEYEKRRTNIRAVKKLSQKSRRRVLNLEEMWRYAYIAHQLRGDPWHQSLWKLFKRNVDKLWPDSLRRHHVS